MTLPNIPDKEPRKPLTKLEFAKLAVQQNGKCAKCGAKLLFEPHQIRDEHVISLHSGGSNDLDNRELWCVPCTKTKDKADAKKHAKINRMQGKAGQVKRRKARGGSSIQGRGFAGHKKFNGEIVWKT